MKASLPITYQSFFLPAISMNLLIAAGITWAQSTTTPLRLKSFSWRKSFRQRAQRTESHIEPALSADWGTLFAAQFPNGGWPQVWPLEGGYHDAITYNDDAMIHVAELMRSVADGKGDFSFVAPDMRNRAAASFAHAISCILATQIVSNGILTVWPQQDDPLTLKPVSGRNFEPPAECSSESAEVLVLLMNDLQNPTAAEGHSIRSAGAWFKRTAIYGQSWHRASEGLVPTPGAGPIWSRFYQTDTELPVFGDRDKSIHDQVNELSKERQNGYRWYGSDPQSALARFEKWSQEHPESR